MTFQKLTPSLVVEDVARSLRFYQDVLGFTLAFSVPDKPPLVFAGLQKDSVEIFLNDRKTVLEEFPLWEDRPIGGTITLYIEVTAIDELFEQVRAKAPVVLPMKTQFYGMREFALADPEGYVVHFRPARLRRVASEACASSSRRSITLVDFWRHGPQPGVEQFNGALGPAADNAQLWSKRARLES